MKRDANGELDACRIVQTVTGRPLEPFDRCPRCSRFHDGPRGSTSGRYDYRSEDLALEVTLLTSEAATQDDRSWQRHAGYHSAPALGRRWTVQVSGTAEASLGRWGTPSYRSFVERLEPELLHLEEAGKTSTNRWATGPTGMPATLRRLGVLSAHAAPADDHEPAVLVQVAFAGSDMPQGGGRKTKKKEQKAALQGETDPATRKGTSPTAEPVQQFDADFLTHLETERDRFEDQEFHALRAIAPENETDTNLRDMARKSVADMIELAHSVRWRSLAPVPAVPRIDGGSDLITLIEAEFRYKSDLGKKLLLADAGQVRREVFFWLHWTRYSAWRRLEREDALPDRSPSVPSAVTGVWVGLWGHLDTVLHWDLSTGWRRHCLPPVLTESGDCPR